MPGWEENGAMSTITTPLGIGIKWLAAYSTVPGRIWESMYTRNLEEWLKIGLGGPRRHDFCQHFVRCISIPCRRGSEAGRLTKGLNIEREELVILDKIVYFEAVRRASGCTSDHDSRHSWIRILKLRCSWKRKQMLGHFKRAVVLLSNPRFVHNAAVHFDQAA